MAEIIVTVNEPVTEITPADETTVEIAVTEQVVEIEVGTSGPQGAGGPQGPAGPAIPVFSASGDLVEVTGLHRFYVEAAATLSIVRASVGVPPTGSVAVIAYRLNGTKLGEVTIADGDFTAVDNTAVVVAAGDFFTVDIEQVGSTFAGADLTVALTLE